MTFICKAGTIACLAITLAAPGASLAQPHTRTPSATTSHFACYSDLPTNLNDALIAAGLARTASKPELFQSGPESACFSKLPPSLRAAWNGAVEYYAKIISPVEFNARQQYLIRMHLAGFDDELNAADARQFAEIAGNFRAAASPAYEACRWPAQDAKNRRSIEDLKSQLAAHEQRIGSRLEQLYQSKWARPIPVDVVETVSWAGANSIIRDNGGGHLLVSTSYQGPAALEIVFHEASHVLMGREAPVRVALAKAASAAGRTLPADLWHPVLFYTTGEVVRQVLEATGKPGYTPMLYEIFGRSPWGAYRQALESGWRGYVDGTRPLAEAAAELIKALPPGKN